MAIEVTPAPSAPTNPTTPSSPSSPPSTLPRAIQQQADRSNELQRLAHGSVTPSGNPGDPAPPAPPNGGTTPFPPSSGAQPQPGQGETPTTPEEWEQRFRSLEGRYRSDIQRQAERVTQLERELTTRAAPQALPPPPAESLLTPEEIADYTPEFIDVVKRAAAEAARPLLHKIGQLEAQIMTTERKVAVSDNQSLHEYMTAQLPEWQQINNSAEFVNWARLPDIYSGAIRQSLMQDAWDRGDGPRVLAFFRGFLAEYAGSPPATPQAPAGNGVAQPLPNGHGSPPPTQPRVTLESLAAPGRARSAPPTPADKPVYTAADITKFYTDVKLGRYRGREAEQQAIDRDIMQAQREGRILTDPRLVAQPPPGFSR